MTDNPANGNDAQLVSQTDDTNPDPRHQHRIAVMQGLFSRSFGQETPEEETPKVVAIVTEIIAKLEELDAKIKQFAPERPLSDINQVDLAILRLIVFESNYTKTPVKVLINEAVELAKEFGTDGSPRFVNGVLGQLLHSEKTQQ